MSRSPFTSYGVECGDGWYGIIDNLSANIERSIRAWQKENPDIKEKHPRVVQVKEKFGGLRFYMRYPSGFDKAFYDKFEHELIGPAEELSEKTCEFCGEEGKRRPGGWIKTLCETCYNKRKER